MHLLLIVTLIWLTINITVFVVLTSTKPSTPQHQLSDYLRRAL